jgi:hypothetical protein
MQSKRNCIPIVSIIDKDNTATYDRFLTHIFEFGNELRTVGIPELGYKKFRVAEPQDMKSSQLCMSRGGTTKQIPYVCHLCQKHSDDIAHPNQMACATCARTPGKLCYCYPLIDTAVIVSLTAKKDTLDTNPEAHRLTFLCEQLYNGGWHDNYSACDLYLVSFGEKPSVFDLPLETATAQYKRYIQNVVTNLSTLDNLCPENKFEIQAQTNHKITPYHLKMQSLQ